MKAGMICSAGGKVQTGNANFSPAPTTDCPVLKDPLSSRAAPPVGACNYTNKVVDGISTTLSPGVYCGGLKLTNGAVVKLSGGIYHYQGRSADGRPRRVDIRDRGRLLSQGPRRQSHVRCGFHRQSFRPQGRPARGHIDFRRSLGRKRPSLGSTERPGGERSRKKDSRAATTPNSQ